MNMKTPVKEKPIWAVRLREMRKLRGFTQESLGKRLNYEGQAAVSAWETGSSQPPGEAYAQLADILDTTTDYLLGRAVSNEPLPDERRAEKPSLATVVSLLDRAKQVALSLGADATGRPDSDSESPRVRPTDQIDPASGLGAEAGYTGRHGEPKVEGLSPREVHEIADDAPAFDQQDAPLQEEDESQP